MADRNIIKMLKIIMVIGFSLILLGIYFHLYSRAIKEMGLTGMVISACCVALGMIMSLPTKMFLTFVLIKREQDQKHIQDTQAEKVKSTVHK